MLNSRAERVAAALAGRGIDAMLITDLANIRYLTGFTGSSARLLLMKKRGYLLTDSRYKLAAKAELKGKGSVKLCICKTAFVELAGIIKKTNVKKLGFEGADVSYDAHRALKRAFKGVGLKSVAGLVEDERVIKDKPELRAIRKAIAVASKGFKGVERSVVSGKSEADIANYIEALVKRGGAEAMSFDTIVAFGKRSALPHASPSGKVIKKGGLLTVDMGVSLGGYKSDETRTYVVGEPTRRQREVYAVVKEAHDSAIDKVHAGAGASEVDAAARKVIKKAGYGRNFGHGTGHGVGINVHERPGLGPKSKDVLKEGMVVTIEPGIYISGWGGVRIEDMVVVTRRGCEVLTDGSQELRILR